jgi:glycosyltransferase involved in cell wall biosynthesis
MTKLVLIVDPRNLVLVNETSKKRHQIYAEKLAEKSCQQILLGVIRFKNGHSYLFEQIDGLLVINLPTNPLTLLFSLYKLIQIPTLMDTKVLVAGDPWESFIFAKLIQRMLSTTPKIQTQIHGDIGNPTWIRLNLRNRARSLLATLTLGRADQIRATSNSHAISIVKRFHLSPTKVKVSPVPSLLSETLLDITPKRPRPATLGFVGRLQDDRGLSDFLKLVTKLSASNAEFSIVIAGEGPRKRIFESDLRKILDPEEVLFLGELNLSEMEGAWHKIGVLVSTAPTESYGRAIREAIFSGVPVWAIPSTGSISLKESLTGDGVQLLDLDRSPNQLRAQFAELLGTEIDIGDREELARIDKEAIATLIDSWIKLVGQ